MFLVLVVSDKRIKQVPVTSSWPEAEVCSLNFNIPWYFISVNKAIDKQTKRLNKRYYNYRNEILGNDLSR